MTRKKPGPEFKIREMRIPVKDRDLQFAILVSKELNAPVSAVLSDLISNGVNATLREAERAKMEQESEEGEGGD
jgi:hypothetical protein